MLFKHKSFDSRVTLALVSRSSGIPLKKLSPAYIQVCYAMCSVAICKMRLRNSVMDPMSYPSTATASSLLHCASLCLRWAAGVGLEMKIKYMYHKHELSNINQVVRTFKYCE